MQVVGPGGPGHAFARASVSSLTKVGALPSGRVLLHAPCRYYDPVGLPLRSARFHHRLIRSVFDWTSIGADGSLLSRTRLSARATPPTPEGPGRLPRTAPAGRGLRRDMTGSAPSL